MKVVHFFLVSCYFSLPDKNSVADPFVTSTLAVVVMDDEDHSAILLHAALYRHLTDGSLRVISHSSPWLLMLALLICNQRRV